MLSRFDPDKTVLAHWEGTVHRIKPQGITDDVSGWDLQGEENAVLIDVEAWDF